MLADCPASGSAARGQGTKVALGPACDGTHGTGSDRKTRTRAPCRLSTWDGTRAPRLYWDLAWELFRPDVLVPDGRPCPFAGPAFQLMRNLALARAKAAPRSVRPTADRAPVVAHREWGLVVTHVATHPNAARRRAELGRFRDLLLDEVPSRSVGKRRAGVASALTTKSKHMEVRPHAEGSPQRAAAPRA